MSDDSMTFADLTAEEKDIVILWRRMTKDQRVMLLLEFMAWIVHDGKEQRER